MSGYIDENARIADDIHNAYEEGYADGKRDAVVHGHWIYRWNQYFRLELPYCSVCEKASPSISKTECCPHCGAKMDEVSE